MADANVPRKAWLKWLWEDVIISTAVAAGLNVAFKALAPKIFDKLTEMLGSHITGKFIDDKRAQILDDFRRMETSQPPISIDNLVRRHAEAITNLSEDRFILLLCKIIVDQKEPTKGRQDTLKWLNDMEDAKFKQMLFLLDQDNHVQFYQRTRDRGARILRSISDGLRNERTRIAQWLRLRFGALGDGIATALDATLDFFPRSFRWLNASWLRIAVIAVISLPIVILVAFLVGPIRRRVFPWVGVVIGTSLVTMAYYLLVPTSLDRTLWFASVLLLTATFFFTKNALVRKCIFCLLVVFTLIFFLGGRTAAKASAAKAVASIHLPSNNPSAPIPRNFQPRRLCDVTEVQDYSDQDLSRTHQTFKITLVEGCYADWYLVPLAWDRFQLQLSSNPGDYASIWCNGHPDPMPIVEYNEDTIGKFRAQMGNTCHAQGEMTSEFHFQGHGTILVTGLSARPYWTGVWLR